MDVTIGPEVFCRKSAVLSIFFGNWDLGTGIRSLMRGMATPPEGNQELLVVRDKVGRPPGELGVSKSMECDTFPFSALTSEAQMQSPGRMAVFPPTLSGQKFTSSLHCGRNLPGAAEYESWHCSRL